MTTIKELPRGLSDLLPRDRIPNVPLAKLSMPDLMVLVDHDDPLAHELANRVNQLRRLSARLTAELSAGHTALATMTAARDFLARDYAQALDQISILERELKEHE